MSLGGGKLVQVERLPGERIVQRSRHDVEEISRYGEKLNPLNLFLRGSEFHLGRLFLTNHRLLLLPYSQTEVDRAHLLQDISYNFLDQVGLGIPQPKIQFEVQPLVIPLAEISALNPYQRQFGIHPTLFVFTPGGSHRLKFVPGESPLQWAQAISELSGSEISRQQAA